jgi:hypothetical protein
MVYNNHIFIRDKCIPNISVYKIPSSNTMIWLIRTIHALNLIFPFYFRVKLW